MSVVPAEMEQIARAESVLSGGGLVVIPTDTVYGLAAKIDIPSAIDRIFEVKGRSRNKPLAVLIADFGSARKLAVFSEEAEEVAERDWPGPLTIVVPRSESARDISLGGDPATIGLRIPDHPFARELLGKVGPLAATSANPAGEPQHATVQEISKSLHGVDLFLDDGPIRGRPSRVISFVDGTRTLRE